MARKIIEVLIATVGSIFIALSFNLFLIPRQLISGGLSGISMIIGYFANWNIGYIYLFGNIPILIWGFIVIGRKFIVLSVFSVLTTVMFMQIIPIYHATDKFDPLISAVFGGVLLGIGSGVLLRIGGSSGGFDIIGSIITRRRNFPLGSFLFTVNGTVVIILGYFKQDWNLALYSMLSMYISSKVVDTIHVRHLKVTAFMITKNKDELSKRLLSLPRGVTSMKVKGAYSNLEQDMLMTVITRYQLAELKAMVKQCDPHAFVAIVETVSVLGEFYQEKS